jgi:hypothetical protein
LPDGEQGLLSEGDEKAERGSEEERAQFVKGKTWFLHHDNTLAHFCLLIRDFLTKHETVLVSQPLYPAEFAPADIFFTMLKSILKGREIKENSLGVMYKKWIKVLLNCQSPVAPK